MKSLGPLRHDNLSGKGLRARKTAILAAVLLGIVVIGNTLSAMAAPNNIYTFAPCQGQGQKAVHPLPRPRTPTRTLTPTATSTGGSTSRHSHTDTDADTDAHSDRHLNYVKRVSSTFAAEADADVRESNPTTNFGLATTLLVDSGSGVNVESYLRFTVSGVSGSIQSAKLRLYVDGNGTANGPAVYATGNTWTETGLTWNNRPAPTSGVLDDKGALSANIWVDYDVTALVTGNGTYSFRLLTDSTDGVIFSSRQGSFPPQLVVTTGTGATVTPTATRTSGPTATPTRTPTRTPTPTATPTGAPSGDAILIGAGDIASCSQNSDEATAKILDATSGTVFTAR
jgi:hypothetical protein